MKETFMSAQPNKWTQHIPEGSVILTVFKWVKRLLIKVNDLFIYVNGS
jgi:hypothetical protein